MKGEDHRHAVIAAVGHIIGDINIKLPCDTFHLQSVMIHALLLIGGKGAQGVNIAAVLTAGTLEEVVVEVICELRTLGVLPS